MAESYEAVAVNCGLEPSRLLPNAELPLWNAGVTSRAAFVAQCRTTADVQAAVRIANVLGLPLSVFSGGNDWQGRAVRDGGLVIDISPLASVDVDVASQTAQIGGGVRSDALARHTESFGLTPVTGTVGSVHVLGLSLGGGYGPLEGRFGLACDNLVAAELVTADGTVRTVDAGHDPDLLWALRGGGGNFGVVTAATVRLLRLDPVHGGMIIYPWSQAESVLTRLDPLLTAAPDELSIQTIIATGPDGEPFVAIMPTWSGSLERGVEAVAPLQRLGTATSSNMGPTTWSTMIAGVAESFPPGRHARIRTRNVAGFSPSVIRKLIEAGSSRSSALSALSIHPFHGAATRIPATSAAFAERRPHQMVEIVALWSADGPADTDWADQLHQSLAEDALPGGYVNLLSSQDHEQISHAYGDGTERLLAIKSRIDPKGVFSATPLPGHSRIPASSDGPGSWS
jgi:hypothetical protein